MRTRALFTVLTLSVAGVVGTATGAAVNDFGSAFVAVAVLTLGVLVIGLLEWDHARPAESRSAVRDGGSGGSPDTQEATDRGHSEDPFSAGPAVASGLMAAGMRGGSSTGRSGL